MCKILKEQIPKQWLIMCVIIVVILAFAFGIKIKKIKKQCWLHNDVER